MPVGSKPAEPNLSYQNINPKQYDLMDRKEAKESRYWMRLIDTQGELELENKRKDLVQKATEHKNIGLYITKERIVLFI